MYQDGRRIVYYRPHNDKINPAVIPHEIVPGCRSRLGPEEKRCAVTFLFGVSLELQCPKRSLICPTSRPPKNRPLRSTSAKIRIQSVRLLVFINIFCFHLKRLNKTSIIVPLMADSTLLNSRNIRTASSAGTLFLSTI